MEVVETHGALIFLVDDIALKIKRAVKYDYMDFSTLDLRATMLQRELELNKPSAPSIYRDVVPITRDPDGRLVLDGDGDPVEWVLRMWRFPKTNELAAIADAGGIDDALANDLGTSVFDYHAQAPHRSVDGAKLIRDILDELDRVFAGMKELLGTKLIGHFHLESRAMLTRVEALLQHRANTGHVRRCHGDLHLHNLVLIDGKPVPFDALEFDEALGTCDVLYDLGFLIMDLLHRDLDRAANIALNAYLLAAKGGEDQGLAALPLFLAVRAAIRAMVSVQTATATGKTPSPDAVQFLEDAVSFTQCSKPSLVLVGGLSGTGKTTVAKELAPFIGRLPGAVHLRTDLERKVNPGAAMRDNLLLENYTPAARDAVYYKVFDRADRIIAAGHSVLLDATFLDLTNQEQAQALGNKTGVTMRMLWLEAPLPVLIDRVRARKGDASDADESVVRHQFMGYQAPESWQIVSAAGALQETVAKARLALRTSEEI